MSLKTKLVYRLFWKSESPNNNRTQVTKYISDINFLDSSEQGDIIEIGIDVVKFGRTSLTLRCEVRNMMTQKIIFSIDNITMVNLGMDGKPSAHGKTKVEFVSDRINNTRWLKPTGMPT